MSNWPRKFDIGDAVEIRTTEGVEGWGRIWAVDWFAGDENTPDIEASWLYTVGGYEYWRHEVDLRKLTTLELLAFEASS